MDLKIVHRLAQLMERHGLTEVELSEENSSVRLVRPRGGAATLAEASPVEAAASTTNDLEPEPETESHYVTSPMPGTFYVARSPEEAPPVDSAGAFNPTLLGLADALPPAAFLLREEE